MTGRNERIQEEAARWVVRREEPDWSDAERGRLDAWLAESMAHKAAFWRLEQGWREADRIGALGEAMPRRRWPAAAARWHALVPYALAASLALAIGVSATVSLTGWRAAAPAATLAFATPTGGHRVVELADGSRVEMNTATAFRTAKAEAGRQDVWLDRGEAFFDIVHRPDRVFVVHAGSGTVTVLGTRFSVRRDGDRMVVAVLSGRVRVEQPATGSATSRGALIASGDIAVAEAGTVLAKPAPRGIDPLLAWRDGMLDFDDTALRDAADEFNRYSVKPIRIVDPGAGGVRIGGMFRAGNGAAFARLLHSAYGMKVRETPDAILVEGADGRTTD